MRSAELVMATNQRVFVSFDESERESRENPNYLCCTST